MRRIEEFWIEFSPEAEQGEKTPIFIGLAYDLFDSFKGAVIVVMLVFTFVFRAVGVQGDSMVPTLHEGDWVAVTGILVQNVQRGDIVVVTQPWERDVPIIKRVIGVGGDRIDIDFESGEVSVNGKVLEEDYINAATHTKYDVSFPLTVPKGKIFVMGDNRNISLDSRSSAIGFIDESYVLGKAMIRFYPFGQMNIYDD